MKKLIIIPLAILLLTLGGCYDYREINNTAIVAGMAVFPGEYPYKYKLVSEVVTMAEGSDKPPKPKVLVQNGDSIIEAIEKTVSISGKPLYFGHTQLLIVDYELAKGGIKPLLDYVARQPDMRLSMNIVVSKGLGPQELFDEQRDVRTFQIMELIAAAQHYSIMPDVLLYKFIADSFDSAEQSYAPIVIMEEGKLKIEDLAIFKGHGLTGQLSSKYVKTFMLTQNTKAEASFTLRADNPENTVVLKSRARKCSVKAAMKDGKMVVDIKFKGEFVFSEFFGQQDIIYKKSQSQLNGELEKEIKESLYDMIEAMRENQGADLLSLKKKLIQSDKDLKSYVDENWDEIYANAVFNIECKPKIVASGRMVSQMKKRESR